MKDNSIDLHFGGPVSGQKRFPRPELEEKIVRLVTYGAGVKMFGLRRTGKSTLLKYVGEAMPKIGFDVVEIDAQGMRSVDQLLFGVLNALSQEKEGLGPRFWACLTQGAVPELVRGVIETMKAGKVADPKEARAISDYWPVLSNQIVRMLEEDKPKLLVTIDELPFLVQNMIADQPGEGPARVDQLLAALRQWRGAGMKMVLAGSIGLAALARKHGFRPDHLNDLSELDVPELSEPDAIRLVEVATVKRTWTKGHTDAFLREVGALYPSFIVKSLLDLPPTATPEQFPAIFSTAIRPHFHDTFFAQFDRRFKFYGEIDRDFQRKLVLSLLRVILATDGETTQLPEVEGFDAIDRRDALSMLVEDGFIAYTEDADGSRTWKPASRLARLWWRNAGL